MVSAEHRSKMTKTKLPKQPYGMVINILNTVKRNLSKIYKKKYEYKTLNFHLKKNIFKFDVNHALQ